MRRLEQLLGQRTAAARATTAAAAARVSLAVGLQHVRGAGGAAARADVLARSQGSLFSDPDPEPSPAKAPAQAHAGRAASATSGAESVPGSGVGSRVGSSLAGEGAAAAELLAAAAAAVAGVGPSTDPDGPSDVAVRRSATLASVAARRATVLAEAVRKSHFGQLLRRQPAEPPPIMEEDDEEEEDEDEEEGSGAGVHTPGGLGFSSAPVVGSWKEPGPQRTSALAAAHAERLSRKISVAAPQRTSGTRPPQTGGPAQAGPRTSATRRPDAPGANLRGSQVQWADEDYAGAEESLSGVPAQVRHATWREDVPDAPRPASNQKAAARRGTGAVLTAKGQPPQHLLRKAPPPPPPPPEQGPAGPSDSVAGATRWAAAKPKAPLQAPQPHGQAQARRLAPAPPPPPSPNPPGVGHVLRWQPPPPPPPPPPLPAGMHADAAEDSLANRSHQPPGPARPQQWGGAPADAQPAVPAQLRSLQGPASRGASPGQGRPAWQGQAKQGPSALRPAAKPQAPRPPPAWARPTPTIGHEAQGHIAAVGPPSAPRLAEPMPETDDGGGTFSGEISRVAARLRRISRLRAGHSQATSDTEGAPSAAAPARTPQLQPGPAPDPSMRGSTLLRDAAARLRPAPLEVPAERGPPVAPRHPFASTMARLRPAAADSSEPMQAHGAAQAQGSTVSSRDASPRASQTQKWGDPAEDAAGAGPQLSLGEQLRTEICRRTTVALFRRQEALPHSPSATAAPPPPPPAVSAARPPPPPPPQLPLQLSVEALRRATAPPQLQRPQVKQVRAMRPRHMRQFEPQLGGLSSCNMHHPEPLLSR